MGGSKFFDDVRRGYGATGLGMPRARKQRRRGAGRKISTGLGRDGFQSPQGLMMDFVARDKRDRSQAARGMR